MGDKTRLGFVENKSTSFSSSTKIIDVFSKNGKFQPRVKVESRSPRSKFVPICCHGGVKDHIRPNCHKVKIFFKYPIFAKNSYSFISDKG